MKLNTKHKRSIAYNVLQLPEGRDFYHKTLFGKLNFT